MSNSKHAIFIIAKFIVHASQLRREKKQIIKTALNITCYLIQYRERVHIYHISIKQKKMRP